MLNATMNVLLLLNSETGSDVSTLHPAQFLSQPIPPVDPLWTPQEPRTLVLALIGVGCIGAFAGIQRWIRAERRKSTSVSQPQSTTRRAA